MDRNKLKEEALKLKGEAHLQLEIWNARLQEANKILMRLFAEEQNEAKKKEANEAKKKEATPVTELPV